MKTKLIRFKAVGLHLMWLTQTNLENEGSLQTKGDFFFYLCVFLKQRKKHFCHILCGAASNKSTHFLFRILPASLLTIMSLVRLIWEQKHS